MEAIGSDVSGGEDPGGAVILATFISLFYLRLI
jgi:hypothetical protein